LFSIFSPLIPHAYADPRPLPANKVCPNAGDLETAGSNYSNANGDTSDSDEAVSCLAKRENENDDCPVGYVPLKGTSIGILFRCWAPLQNKATATGDPLPDGKRCQFTSMIYSKAYDSCFGQPDPATGCGKYAEGSLLVNAPADSRVEGMCKAPTTAANTAGQECDNGQIYDATAGGCVAPKGADGKCPEGMDENPNANGDANKACIATGTDNDGCPIEKGKTFRWAECWAFDTMNGFTKVLDAFIDEYMATGNIIYGSSEQSFKNAWTTFRNTAIGIVFLAGLVMLVSEALGVPILDAYTSRKVAPRLLIALIGIAVSWGLCKWFVMFFDDIGHALGNVIFSAFNMTAESVNPLGAIFGQVVSGVGVFAVAGYLLAGGILSLLGTVLLAMLCAAAVLIIRQSLIVFCVIIAPLAIAAYVLPNTSKFADFWWKTFMRMLILYPFAVGFVTLGKVIAQITMSTAG
jgi:hypothetical protein